MADSDSGLLVDDQTVVVLPTEPVDYLERNRLAWDSWAPRYIAAGRTAWQKEELHWGAWGVPESELRLLADVQVDDDMIELGCGTASVPAWLARRGVRPVGVDISSVQLQTAERLQQDFDLAFPLVHANAEDVGFDADSFDVVLSEYGPSLWCNPRRWLPEANRLLRPGGRLIFFTHGMLLMACTGADGRHSGQRLVRDSFAQYRVEFDDAGAVEFHVMHGHWIRLLRATGFVVENLIEVRPPAKAKPRFDFSTLDWARRWPSEEVWIARKGLS